MPERNKKSDAESSPAGMRALLRSVSGVLRAPRPPQFSRPVSFLVAMAATVLVVALQLVVLPQPTIAPFLFVYFGVVLAAWLGGRLVGVLSGVLSVLLVNRLFIPPFDAWANSGPALTASGFFVLTATAIALLCGAFREAFLEGERAAASLGRQSELLRQSEARFRQLADSMPQLVWTAEPDGTVDYLNERCREFSGFAQHASGSWMWQPGVHPEDRPATEEAWATAVSTGEKYEIAHRMAYRDGSFRWYLVRGVPVRDASGQVVKWYGTATDIDAQKRAEAALREADARKNQFLAMLSHELRNPLAPIRSSVHVLSRAEAGSAQGRRACEIIERQALHLTHLVDDLLDITRITRGKIHLQRERLLLNDVVRRAVEDHRELFRRSGIGFTVHVDDQPLTVDADPTRMAQVVGNLLSNAAKFTPRGGRASLRLHADEDGRAVIAVRDNGVGIEPAVLARLFEPFVQADSTLDRSRGGLGLGLALVKGLVDLHGGSVWAHSAGVGTGTEIRVTLPVQRQPATRVESMIAAPAARPRRRVLVIEDNHDAAQSLKEALELDDHVVEVAHDGPEGIDKARAFRPEVILCDIGLPQMDGYDVARTLRGEPELSSIHLVALSGYVSPEDQERSAAAGFARHLAKPADLETIEQALAEAPVWPTPAPGRTSPSKAPASAGAGGR